MTQKLASIGGVPQAYGTITFPAPDLDMVEQRGGYRCIWTGIKAGDVVLSDVADDYTLPSSEDEPVTTPAIYAKAEFKQFCYGVLGTLAAPTGTDQQKMGAGIAAMGKIMRALRATDASDAVYQCGVEYDDADHLEKSKTTVFLGILNAADPKIVSDAQLGALLGAWENE